MTLLSKEERAEELLEETIPRLEEDGDGDKLTAAYQELLQLSTELVEEHNRYSWNGVPEKCRAQLYSLEEIRRESQREQESDDKSRQKVESDDSTLDEDSEEEVNERPRDTGSVPDSEMFEVIEPSVTFDDIVGLHDVKGELKKRVELPLTKSEELQQVGVDETPRGMVLSGPPGCGKTMICKAAANEFSAVVLKVKGSDIVSKYVGEPQQNMAALFDRAKELQPCIVFLDEIDQLLSARGGNTPKGHDQMVSEFLANFSEIGADENIFVVGATNLEERLDRAATRPGRLDETFYVPAPSEAERAEFILDWLEEAQSEVSPGLVYRIAEATDWYSFADLDAALNKAGINVVYDGRNCIEDGDIRGAFRDMSPSIDPAQWQDQQEASGHWD